MTNRGPAETPTQSIVAHAFAASAVLDGRARKFTPPKAREGTCRATPSPAKTLVGVPLTVVARLTVVPYLFTGEASRWTEKVTSFEASHEPAAQCGRLVDDRISNGVAAPIDPDAFITLRCVFW